MNIERIKLNLIPTGKMPVCHTSQYDKGRDIGIDIFYGMKPYILTDETLELDVRKPDTHIVTIDVPVVSGKNGVTFRTTEQMCAVAGSNLCELKMRRNGDVIGSLNFFMEVERSPMEGGLASDSEIENLSTQVAEVATPVVESIAPPIIRDYLDDSYYDKEQTDEKFATKTDLNEKANVEDVYDKTEMDTKLGEKANASDVYNKTEVNSRFNNKMDKANPTGTGSISVGSNMLNIGSNSQTFGSNTKALGNNAFATGENTQASVANQFVFGKYNQYSFGNLVEIVGNGTSESNRSNARMLDWSGNETLAGDLTFNGNKSLTSEISRLDRKIDNLPAPMVFKGTLGTGGTIEVLPVASDYNEGWTYKVITDGTYAGQTAKVGDVFTSNGSAWVLIPSGDEDNDTWRAIKVNGTEELGSGISSGSVDFVGSENIDVEFDSNGNKIGIKTKNIYTKAEVNDIVAEAIYDVLPSEVASGSVANFETDLALPIKSIEVDVNAVQVSGTPTPATPLPISGWSEINLYKLGGNFFNKNTVTNGSLINGSGNEVSYADWNISDFIPVIEGASYYFYGLTVHPNTNQDNFELFNASKVKVGFANVKTNQQPYVIPSGVAYIKCCVKNQDLNTAQLGVSVNASFVPYNPTLDRYVINLDGTYYGGHFTQDKDGHRQFVCTHEKKKFSDFSWYKGNMNTANTGRQFYVYFNNYPDYNSFKEMLCDSLLKNNTTNWNALALYEFTAASSNYFVICVEDYASSAAMLADYGNIEFTVILKNPFTIDLPDGVPITTFAGVNNIFCDTGDTEVEFKESVNKALSSVSSNTRGGAKLLGGSEVQNEKEIEEQIEEPKEDLKEIGEEPISRK